MSFAGFHKRPDNGGYTVQPKWPAKSTTSYAMLDCESEIEIENL